MSYILESLKKSDKERQEANSGSSKPLFEYVPGVIAEGQQKKYGLLLFFVAVLVTLFAASFWFFWQAQERSPIVLEHSQPAIEAEEQAAEGQVVQKEIFHDKPVAQEKTAENKPPSKNIIQEKTEALEKKVLKKELPKKVVLTEVKTSPDVAALYQQSDQREVQQEVQQELQQEQPLLQLTQDIEQEISELESPVEVVEEKKNSIPSIYELSAALRDVIPSINYGAHVYATDNLSGFVILNGSKHKAGSPMSNGVYVEQVNPDDVVLSYQGVLFSLPAMKSWKVN